MGPGDSAVQVPADLKGKIVGTGTTDGAKVGLARNVMSGSGLKDEADQTFLTVGDGGPAAAAVLTGKIGECPAATANAAILNQGSVALRGITRPEYMRLFGSGFVTGLHHPRQPGTGKKFVGAIYKDHALDEANREKVPAHLATVNLQEYTDPTFASGLCDAVRTKTHPVDKSRSLGWQPPGVCEEWQATLIAGGHLASPLPDLTAA